MEYLITLVHGTFAAMAPWTSEASNLRNKISASLGVQHKIEFTTFDWSGKNSNAARFQAAEKLAVLLNNQVSDYPEKKKVIIAHSHGGNIAMYALKILGEQKNGIKLVTMATPFLNSRIRSYEKNISTHIILIPLLLCFVAFIILMWVGYSIFSKVEIPFVKGIISQAIFFYILLMGTFGCLYQLGEKIHGFLKRKTEKLPDELKQMMERMSLQDDSCNYPILAVIDHSDEIRLWFENLYRFWEIILNIYEGLTSMIKWLIIILFFSLVVLIITGLIFRDTSKVYESMFATSIIIWYILFILALCIPILTFFIPFLFLLIRSNPAILGWENWKSQLFIRTTPSSTPLGYQNLMFIQYDLKRNTPLSLKHSIYEHDIVIDNLSNWIKQ